MIHHGRHQFTKLLSVTTFFSFLIVLPSRGQVDLELGKLERLEGQIVFESERDAPAGAIRFGGHGRTEIYVMDVDGSNQRRLTYTVGDDRRSTLPHWSPDRRKIAFSTGSDRHMEIYVMHRDGSNVRRIWKAEGHTERGVGATVVARRTDTRLCLQQQRK